MSIPMCNVHFWASCRDPDDQKLMPPHFEVAFAVDAVPLKKKKARCGSVNNIWISSLLSGKCYGCPSQDNKGRWSSTKEQDIDNLEKGYRAATRASSRSGCILNESLELIRKDFQEVL